MKVYEQQIIEGTLDIVYNVSLNVLLVIKRDTPTVIGFHVMKAKIELDRSIVPIDKNDFEHNEKVQTYLSVL